MENYQKAWHQIVKPHRFSYDFQYEVPKEFSIGEHYIVSQKLTIKTNEKNQ
jgi:hypothetical protein